MNDKLINCQGSGYYTSLLKLEFHYADFATKFATLLQTQIMKVCDTNHVANFCDLCLRQSPRQSRELCHLLSSCIVTD